MFSFVSLILPLAVLVWLVWRGWPILFIAPAMAGLASLLAQQPVLPNIALRFPQALGGFVISFFLLFLLGSLFGRIMQVTGAAHRVANAITGLLGARNAIPATVAACAALTYGGVSLFVVAFAVYPLALALFQSADLPRRLIPATIALGAFTFTMTALPGTPAIQNAIPIPYFGTTLFAAPGLGLIAATIMCGGGLIWLTARARRLQQRGQNFTNPTEHRSEPPPANISLLAALIPLISMPLVNAALVNLVFPSTPLAQLADAPWNISDPNQITGLWSVLMSLTLAIGLAVMLAPTKPSTDEIAAGANACLLPLFNTAALVGFGTVIAALPAFTALREQITALPGGVLTSLALSTALLAGLTGSASGGMTIALEVLAPTFLPLASAQNISPDLLHRITVLATGALDALPHNGAVITLLGIAGLSHKDAYADIAAVAVVIPLLALGLSLLLAVHFGAF